MKNYPLIDILKFVSALSIISIHTQPMLGFQDSLWFIPYRWLQCFALPFFFVSSAYLFFSKAKTMNEKSNRGGYFVKWIKRTSILYGIYSLLNIILGLGAFFSFSWKDMIGFILLGQQNGYLWFIAALILSITFIYGIDEACRGNKVILRSLHGLFFLLSFFLMVVLQFGYVPISHTSLSWIADVYYQHFDNVRNFVSGIFFSYIGYMGVLLHSHYSQKLNRLAIVALGVLSLIEVWYCNVHSIWHESCQTAFGISVLLLFVIIECTHVSCKSNTLLLYMRKTSNIIYFQHRYAIILLLVVSKLLCPIQPVAMFFFTVAIMCFVSYLFFKLEATKLGKYTKYLY